MPPHPGTGGGAGARNGQPGTLRILGQQADQAGHGGIGGHLPEHLRLRPQHRDIRGTVASGGDRDRQIQHDLARIMHRPRRPPQTQPIRQAPGQAAASGRFHQQMRPRAAAAGGGHP